MIKSNFTKYFTSQDALDSISVTEIENLIEEAPSSDLYRLLLANKMNGLHLNNAALTSSDRLLLEDIVNGKFQQVTNQDPIKNGTANHKVSAPIFQEEVLIETEIPYFEENPIILEIHSEEKNEDDSLSTSTQVDSNQVIETHDVDIQFSSNKEIETDKNEAIIEDTEATETVESNVAQLNDESDEKPGVRLKKHKKSKKFKLQEFSGLSEYALWLMSFKHDDIEKKLKKENKKAQKRLLEASVQKSVTKSEEIISESLAQILEKQGHLDDAKKMYEQLMHKYPEKSRYFAAKIDKLLKSL